VNGSEFLAEMEEGGVIPNRVTFQHLIGKKLKALPPPLATHTNTLPCV